MPKHTTFCGDCGELIEQCRCETQGIQRTQQPTNGYRALGEVLAGFLGSIIQGAGRGPSEAYNPVTELPEGQAYKGKFCQHCRRRRASICVKEWRDTPAEFWCRTCFRAS